MRASIFVFLGLVLASGASARGVESFDSVKGTVCDSCVLAVRVFEDFLCDASAVDMTVEFFEKQICPITGQTEQCDQLSEVLVPVALEYLRASITPSEMCSSAGVCGAQSVAVKEKPRLRLRSTDLECPLCTFIIGQLQAAMADPATQTSIMDAAEKICSHLPAEVAAGCTSFVDTYEPVIVAYIDSVNATDLCNMVGACTASWATNRPAPLTPGVVKTMAAVYKALKPFSASNVGVVPSNDLCDNCKLSVIEAHSLITNPAVQSDIVMYAKVICDTVGGGDMCKSLVDAYAPSLFATLAQALNSDALCAQVHLCKPKGLSGFFNSILLNRFFSAPLTH